MLAYGMKGEYYYDVEQPLFHALDELYFNNPSRAFDIINDVKSCILFYKENNDDVHDSDIKRAEWWMNTVNSMIKAEVPANNIYDVFRLLELKAALPRVKEKAVEQATSAALEYVGILSQFSENMDEIHKRAIHNVDISSFIGLLASNVSDGIPKIIKPAVSKIENEVDKKLLELGYREQNS